MMSIFEIVLWGSFLCVFYAYIGYPILLLAISKMYRQIEPEDLSAEPSLSIIIPMHNEEKFIKNKMENIFSQDYPSENIELIIVSDASTDSSESIVEEYTQKENVVLLKSKERKGKANALNLGLVEAKGEVIVFTDASIELNRDSLRKIVKRFGDERIGCISGEDHIPETGGEGAYGRYELSLRNLESKVSSIVGASGSFYAQRKKICQPFVEGMAPDFLSVLNTVEQGYRAVTEPEAIGVMGSVKSSQDEFQRKVRTLLRGMTTMFYKKQLLNPLKYGFFAFELFSHKIMRWLVPFFLLGILIGNIGLLNIGFYQFTFLLQILFYLVALLAAFHIAKFDEKLFGKIPLYFLNVNIAIFVAWVKYFSGVRQEIWAPSKRA